MGTALSALHRQKFLEAFPALFIGPEWTTAKRDAIIDTLGFRSIEAGGTILREGQVCTSLPFVIEGLIRIFKISDQGREITLYRIESGQSCILSAGCAVGTDSFPATVVAEKPTKAAFMPHPTVRRLYAESASFRDFMLGQYAHRMEEVIELVEEIAFRKVDERLHQWLVESADSTPGGLVEATHQELADHMGSSREVISRILKDWEERRLVELFRGSLRVLPAFRSLR